MEVIVILANWPRIRWRGETPPPSRHCRTPAWMWPPRSVVRHRSARIGHYLGDSTGPCALCNASEFTDKCYLVLSGVHLSLDRSEHGLMVGLGGQRHSRVVGLDHPLNSEWSVKGFPSRENVSRSITKEIQQHVCAIHVVKTRRWGCGNAPLPPANHMPC